MKTVRNLTQKPLAVPLPGGRTLHLGPGRNGEISARAATHPPLLALVDAGALEIGTGGHHATGPASANREARGSSTGHRPGRKSARRGDR